MVARTGLSLEGGISVPFPAYYLGRPAHVYINAMTPKSRRLENEVEATKEAKEKTPDRMAARAKAVAARQRNRRVAA
jgi:hypothetical protein